MCLSKVVENIISKRLTEYLAQNKLMCVIEFVYRFLHSNEAGKHVKRCTLSSIREGYK